MNGGIGHEHRQRDKRHLHLGTDTQGKWISWLERLNDIVGMLVEFPAALLVAAEVVVLLMGVIWRYVLQTPLVWSDELASILFLWLAMLGSIVALRRGEHMRMTASSASSRGICAPSST